MTDRADPETALQQIVETADVFEAGGGTWLLAPAPPELVDTLAVVGAAEEDHEADAPVEDDDAPEDDDLDEINGDDELAYR